MSCPNPSHDQFLVHDLLALHTHCLDHNPPVADRENIRRMLNLFSERNQLFAGPLSLGACHGMEWFLWRCRICHEDIAWAHFTSLVAHRMHCELPPMCGQCGMPRTWEGVPCGCQWSVGDDGFPEPISHDKDWEDFLGGRWTDPTDADHVPSGRGESLLT